MAYVVMAYIVIASIVAAYTGLYGYGYIVMACGLPPFPVDRTYIVMAYTVMACGPLFFADRTLASCLGGCSAWCLLGESIRICRSSTDDRDRVALCEKKINTPARGFFLCSRAMGGERTGEAVTHAMKAGSRKEEEREGGGGEITCRGEASCDSMNELSGALCIAMRQRNCP